MLSSVLIPGREGPLRDRLEELEGSGDDGSCLGHHLNTSQMHLLMFSRWNKWALSRGKRELQAFNSYPSGLADEKTNPTETLIPLQDKQSTSRNPQAR